jgi:hypothetical protein
MFGCQLSQILQASIAKIETEYYPTDRQKSPVLNVQQDQQTEQSGSERWRPCNQAMVSEYHYFHLIM